MTEKHPNIKRPIETAPKDGTKILLWGTSPKPTIIYWEYGDWYNTDGILQHIPHGYWSPMPENERPQYCCDAFSTRVSKNLFYKHNNTNWFLMFGPEYPQSAIYFCPFCGEKLK